MRFSHWLTHSEADGRGTAALEVYVRRAYRAYTLMSIDYDPADDPEDADSPNAVTWRFKLGQTNSPPVTPRVTSDG